MRRFASASLTVVVLASGCSLASARDDAAPRAADAVAAECKRTGLVTEGHAGGGPGPPPIHWDEPWPSSGLRTFETVDEAARVLPFEPLHPGDLRPCEIVASAAGPAVLGMRFQHPEFGMFMVTQMVIETPADAYERRQRALPRSCPRQPGCTPTFSLVRLADGRDALLALGKNETWLSTHAISFIDDQENVEVVIQGPPRTFQRADAVAVANGFVATP